MIQEQFLEPKEIVERIISDINNGIAVLQRQHSVLPSNRAWNNAILDSEDKINAIATKLDKFDSIFEFLQQQRDEDERYSLEEENKLICF